MVPIRRFLIWSDDENLGLIAAGVAFYAMFAIFPGLAAVITLWGFFSDPHVIESSIPVLQRFMPTDAYRIFSDQVIALVNANNSSLGWATLITILIALYSAHAGVAALVRGLNTIHACRHRQGAHRTLITLVLTLSIMGLVLIALATIVVVPLMLALVEFGPAEARIVAYLPWIAMALMSQATFGIIYRYGPNFRRRKMPWFTPGAVLATVLWGLASIAFSYYLGNFGSYNEIYGSLGAVAALLMWLYIGVYAVLLGAALNAALHKGEPRAAPRPA